MPITLAKITSNTAEISMMVGEDTVNVTYYPGRVTEKTIAQLQGYADVNPDHFAETVHEVNVLMANLIKSWDVLENDEVTMFPLDPERLAELPFMFRTKVVVAIMQDIRPEADAPQM